MAKKMTRKEEDKALKSHMNKFRKEELAEIRSGTEYKPKKKKMKKKPVMHACVR
jgi:hypothetical protein